MRLRKSKKILLMLSLALSLAAGLFSFPVQAKSKIKLNYTSATRPVGSKITLKVKGVSARKVKLTWKSSKPSVAKVTKKGLVTAKKAGTARITVKIKGKGINTKRTFRITVQTKQKYNARKLYNYILKKGKLEDGYYTLTRKFEITDGAEGTMTSTISVKKGSYRMYFDCMERIDTPNDFKHITMNINLNTSSKGSLYFTGLTDSYADADLKLWGTITTRYDGASAGISWTKQEVQTEQDLMDGEVKESTTVDDFYAARGQSTVRDGFEQWNILVKKAGISMKDLGFSKYK